jgi:hypothetical protein
MRLIWASGLLWSLKALERKPMNRRLISVAVLGMTLSLGGSVSYAQTAGIPQGVKTAATVTDTDRGTIRLFISAQVAKLTGDKPAAQAEAREALVNEASGIGAATSSAAYQDAYCALLNDALVQLAASPSPKVRLNAAIVAARVTDRVNSAKLEPAILKFLQDKSPSVFLWGVKAARQAIPVIASGANPSADPLLSGFVAAIHDRLSAEVSQEAYEALRLNIAVMSDRKQMTPKMVQAVVPEMQKLLEARTAQYKNGVPADPAADALGTSFLVDGSVWAAQDAKQQTRTMQLMVDMVSAASKRAVSFDPKDSATRAKREEVLEAIRRVARSMQAGGEVIKNDTLSTAAVAVSKLDVSTDNKVIASAINDLVSAAASAVPGVKRPATAAK